MQVIVTGKYRQEQTTVRPSTGKTKSEREYLSISKRAIKAAADRCCFAGDDTPVVSQVNGYSEWQDTESGDLRCFKI